MFVAGLRWVFGAADGAGKAGRAASGFSGGGPCRGGRTLGARQLATKEIFVPAILASNVSARIEALILRHDGGDREVTFDSLIASATEREDRPCQ